MLARKALVTKWRAVFWARGSTRTFKTRIGSSSTTTPIEVHNYADRDEIYLFGFSRGAYTARSTAGLIRNIGILKKIHAHLIPRGYKLYRQKSKSDASTAIEFRRKYSQEVRIAFVGVCDTVGALGIPSRILRHLNEKKYAFHDTSLSKIIVHACHAVAIDEKRVDFKPTLWERLPLEGQKIEQVWAGFKGSSQHVLAGVRVAVR